MKFNLLLLTLGMLLPIEAAAYNFEVDGIYYQVNGEDAIVTYESLFSHAYSGDVTIPETVTWNDTVRTVTAIGNNAFYGCTGLTGITIPGTITSIGSAAFYGCSKLDDICIPRSVTAIGSSAFSGTAWYDNHPDGLVYAGHVIYKYKGVMPEGTSVIINYGTFGIAGSAFGDCYGLTSVSIPNTVTHIGNSAFYDCRGLTIVIIPASVTTIENWAFGFCSNLTEIHCLATMPPAIQAKTFHQCYGATLFVPEASVETYQTTEYWNLFATVNGQSETIPGDVDGDGLLNIGDVTTLISYLLRGEAIDERDLERADLNHNNRLDIDDVTTLINMLLSGN